MTNLNQVIFIGRLTKDAEIKKLENGTTICRYSVAINRDYYSKAEGTKKTETTYVDSAIFGKFAENFGIYLAKGCLVNVQGHLRMRTQVKENKTFHTLDVITDNMELLASPKNKSHTNTENDASASVSKTNENENLDYDKINANAKSEAAAIDVDYEYNENKQAIYGDIF